MRKAESRTGEQGGRDARARRLSHPFPFRDGRFRLGDEIVNVNGKSLRGLSMDEARALLGSSAANDVDVILAREDGVLPAASAIHGVACADILSQSAANGGSSHTPVERRKRRKLPMIERPRSAPIHHQQECCALNSSKHSHKSQIQK